MNDSNTTHSPAAPTKAPAKAALLALAYTERHGLTMQSDYSTGAAGDRSATMVRGSVAVRLFDQGYIVTDTTVTPSTFFHYFRLTAAGVATLDAHGAEQRAEVAAKAHHYLDSTSTFSRGDSPIKGGYISKGGIVRCACGREFRSNSGIRDAKDSWKYHVKQAAAAIIAAAEKGLEPPTDE